MHTQLESFTGVPPKYELAGHMLNYGIMLLEKQHLINRQQSLGF